MYDLHVSGRKYAGAASTLAYPPAVRLLLMDGYQVTRTETELVVQIRRILIDRATLLRVFGVGRRNHFRTVDRLLIIVVLRVTAELVEIAEVVLVGRILGIAVASRPIDPVARLGILILRQMHLEFVIVVLNLKRFVLCPRRNLQGT